MPRVALRAATWGVECDGDSATAEAAWRDDRRVRWLGAGLSAGRRLEVTVVISLLFRPGAVLGPSFGGSTYAL